MLDKYVEGSSITWVKNPNYWGIDERFPGKNYRLPYVDKIKTLIIKDPATYVNNTEELLKNEQLKVRRFWTRIEHPKFGKHRYCGLPIKLSKTPAGSKRPAPCLGEHNEYVLGEILGLPEEEIKDLEEQKVISKVPTGEV